MTRRIVALGGGGFSMDPDDPRLDDHVLSLTGVSRPKVLFVPTASGDSADHCARFRAAFPPERAEASVLTLFQRDVADLHVHVLAHHVGISAGMNCWFSASVTDSFGPGLAGLDDGLGFLPGSACPHYDGEPGRRPAYRRLVGEGFPAGYAADDGAALVFADGELDEVVASRPGTGAYRVERHGDEVVESRLPVRTLA